MVRIVPRLVVVSKLRRVALAAAAAAGTAQFMLSTTATASTVQPIRLAATKITAKQDFAVRPTLVLIHGLDSTRFTWDPFISRCAGRYNILALDQRGHGESPLGEEADFSAAALAADIRHTLREEQVKLPIVLLGHSMGGRTAMQYCADYPEDLAAVIVEDMDIVPRTSPPATDQEMAARRGFTRAFASWDEAKKTLAQWYNAGRIDSWKGDGRVFEKADGSWWSGINPMAQWLAIRHVLGSEVGKTEWEKCQQNCATNSVDAALFVATQGSACHPDSLEEMTQIFPKAKVVVFDGAWHSIHNSQGFENAFNAKVEEVMEGATHKASSVQSNL